MQTRKIYFLFDFPNIAKSCASAKGLVYLHDLVDWNQLKRCLKDHAHTNYPGNLSLEFVVFLNRRSAKQSRSRIKTFKKSGYRKVVKHSDGASTGVGLEIFGFVKQILQKPETAAIYILGNDIDNVEMIASYMVDPISALQDDGHYCRVYDGNTDLWIGIMPSVLRPYTYLDRFPDNVQRIDIEKFAGVFLGVNSNQPFAVRKSESL